jgi:predicted CoA-binding protein
MTGYDDAVAAFLSQERIAVVGVSRSRHEAANAIFKKLRDTGHRVVPVNPRASEVEGAACFPDLRSVPGGIGAAMICTPPAATASVVRECAELGVRHVWLHRSFGAGSVSEAAIALANKHGIQVIPGGCPMMFVSPDPAHRCMKWFLQWRGKIPKEI